MGIPPRNKQGAPHTKLGRPLSCDPEERRGRLLHAAMDVFSSRGYTAATTDAIAVKAGMSKKTLYRVFPSKMVLFDALLEEQFYRIPISESFDGLDPEEELAQLLLLLANFLLAPERQVLVRLIVTEGQALPELMSTFRRLEMGRDLNHIEQWVIRHEKTGYLKVANVVTTAKLLFDMTLAGPILSALVQAPVPEEAETLSRQIREALHVVLVGTGIKTVPRASLS